MKRSESLALLHVAAYIEKNDPGRVLDFDGASRLIRAQQHGLSAVRAIREWDENHVGACELPPETCGAPVDQIAVSESRLAVRLALAAVGLKTL